MSNRIMNKTRNRKLTRKEEVITTWEDKMKPTGQHTRKEKGTVSFCKNCLTSFCSVSVIHRQGLNQDTCLMLSSDNSFPTNESTNRLMLLINYHA